MVQSLEQYVAQATQAYQPTSNAIQSQIDALPGQLQTTNDQINRNYAQQMAGLERQRNMAAETASMQAAGSGGSFGGAANIANRKYYDRSFVPAVTQMRTNQTNDLASARQAYDDNLNNLNSQMANVQAQANQQALAQYYADQEAERNRQAQLQAQREATAAQNAYYKYLMDAARAQQAAPRNTFTLASEKNRYGGYDWTDANGNLLTAGQVAQGMGGDFNQSLLNALSTAAEHQSGDYYSRLVADAIRNGATYAINNSRNTGNSVWDTLGIVPTSNKRTYLSNGLTY